MMKTKSPEIYHMIGHRTAFLQNLKNRNAYAPRLPIRTTLLGFSLTHNNNSERRNWSALAISALDINKYSAG